jgi:hypothetical protein
MLNASWFLMGTLFIVNANNMKEQSTPGNKSLKGKRIVLPGGTSGFGLAIAQAIAN